MEKNDSSGRSERIDSSAADMIDYQRRQKQQLLAQQRRTTTILACQVLIFGLTWLPHNIVSLIIEYDESSSFFNRSADGEPNLVYLISMITHR
jgi:neuropeptide Y receptor